MSSSGATDEIAAALRDSMSPRDRLAGWAFRWSLQSGQLVCAQCQASQSANQAEAAFVHRVGCCARRDEQPLHELACLLGAVGMRQAVRA